MNTGRAFRFGLIGGRWGVNYLRTVSAQPSWEIPLVARASNTSLPDPFSEIPVTTDWKSLGDKKLGLDGVIIVTPPETHIEMARYFINRGIPVLIEKPVALDPAAARDLQKIAREKSAIVWVDHTHLFHPAFRKLKSLVKDGSIDSITTNAGNIGPFRDDTPVHWDWLPHDVAMILDLVGETPVSAAAARIAQEEFPDGTGSTISFSMKFKSGLETSTIVSNINPVKTREFTVQAEGTLYRYDGINAPALSVSNTDAIEISWSPLDTPQTLPLETLLSEFSSAIASNTTENQSLELACRVIEAIECGSSKIGP